MNRSIGWTAAWAYRLAAGSAGVTRPAAVRASTAVTRGDSTP